MRAQPAAGGHPQAGQQRAQRGFPAVRGHPAAASTCSPMTCLYAEAALDLHPVPAHLLPLVPLFCRHAPRPPPKSNQGCAKYGQASARYVASVGAESPGHYAACAEAALPPVPCTCPLFARLPAPGLVHPQLGRATLCRARLAETVPSPQTPPSTCALSLCTSWPSCPSRQPSRLFQGSHPAPRCFPARPPRA